MEGPNTLALALPFFRQSRNGFALGIRTDQTIHQLTDNRIGRHIAAHLRIQRTRLDAVADHHALIIGTFKLRSRLNIAAARRQREYGSQ